MPVHNQLTCNLLMNWHTDLGTHYRTDRTTNGPTDRKASYRDKHFATKKGSKNDIWKRKGENDRIWHFTTRLVCFREDNLRALI